MLSTQTRLFCAAAVLLTTAACTATPQSAEHRESGPVMQVFKSLGGRQCESGGSSASELARQLEQSGVRVRQIYCGQDGLMRPSVCGAGDGRIAILDIDHRDAAAAAEQGFAPLSRQPEARVVPCPAQSGAG